MLVGAAVVFTLIVEPHGSTSSNTPDLHAAAAVVFPGDSSTWAESSCRDG